MGEVGLVGSSDDSGGNFLRKAQGKRVESDWPMSEDAASLVMTLLYFNCE